MLDTRAAEALLCEIVEHQIVFRYRSVLREVPGLANPEVAQQIIRRIRLKRNGNEIAEQFMRFAEETIGAR